MLGLLWTLIESLAFFSSDVRAALESSVVAYLIVVLVSVLVGFVDSLPSTAVSFKIPGFSTRLNLSFTDLFSTPGFRIIPVNEFIDSLLGDHVSPKSLHGQLIEKRFAGRPEGFDAAVAQAARNLPFEEEARPSGNTRRYPIGTCVRLPISQNENYLLLVVARTNPATLKAESDPSTLWTALCSLWTYARERGGGETFNVPLVGGGIAGVGMPADQLLKLLLLSLYANSRNAPLAGEVCIALHSSVFDVVDLDRIKSEWS